MFNGPIKCKGNALIINTTNQEIIGLLMHILINDFPTYRMHWTNYTRYGPTENTMSRNWY